MARVNCETCRNKKGFDSCKFDFRMAAGAAGQAVYSRRDVFFCQDVDEEEDDTDEEENNDW